MTSEEKALIEVRNLKKYFPLGTGFVLGTRVGAVKAVDDVSFDIHEGRNPGACGRKWLRKDNIRTGHPPIVSPYFG